MRERRLPGNLGRHPAGAAQSAAGHHPVGRHRGGLLRYFSGGGLDAGQRLCRPEQGPQGGRLHGGGGVDQGSGGGDPGGRLSEGGHPLRHGEGGRRPQGGGAY